MSYTRVGSDSDVYAYASMGRRWHCMPCGIFKDLLSLRKHLLEHRKKGDKVPKRCFDRIDSEIQDE